MACQLTLGTLTWDYLYMLNGYMFSRCLPHNDENFDESLHETHTYILSGIRMLLGFITVVH